jgi:pyrroline-5-carboxylate reductase
MRIALIGGGAMGEAIVGAITRGELAAPQDVRVHDIAAERVQYLAATYKTVAAATPDDALQGADFVVLDVHPQHFGHAAEAIAGKLGGATAVSIMAGVTVNRLRSLLQTDAVVRAMPNTPAQIGEGMTVWTATPSVGDAARQGVRQIFAALGKEAFVPEERYLDMATGLSGSGPAYVFLFIEALTDAGVHVGLSRDMAYTMALQTVIGSARYAEKTGRHPAMLRNQVTSPGGTTAEALRAFEKGSFRSDVLEAVIASYNKSRALGEEAQK